MMNFSFIVIAPLLNILICFGLALFIISRDYRSPANMGFASGLLGLLILEIGNALVMASSHVPQWMLRGLQLGIAGQLMLPPSWLLFSLTFSRGNQEQLLRKWKPLLAGVVILSLVFLMFINSPEFIVMYSVTADDSLKPVPLFRIGSLGWYAALYLTLGALGSLVILENTLRFSKGHTRWRIKYVIFSVGMILFFLIYYLSPLLFFSAIKIELVPVFSLVILFSLLVMTFFIARYRLLNVELYVSRYVVYNSMTLLMTGAYFILVGLIVNDVRRFTLPFNASLSVLIVFFAFFMLLLFSFSTTVRRKMELFLSRHFYRHKYEFRDKWMESIEKISSRTSVPAICQTLIDMIAVTMGAREVHLWLYCPASKYYKAFGENITGEYSFIKNDDPLMAAIRKYASPFDMSEAKEEKQDRERIAALEKFIKATGAVLCSPLNAGDEAEGFVVLGADVSGEPYQSDDFELLKALTAQAAVQLRNINLSQELMAVKEANMFNKMSSFIMHDLKNLTYSLSLVSQNAAKNMDNPEFQKDAVRTIDNTVKRMTALIEKLSVAPRKIDLKKEKVDVKKLIHSAMNKIMEREKRFVCTADLKELPLICADAHAIEMILINLLTNASDALENNGVISVQSNADDKFITIIIRDNGGGMTREFIESSLFQPFKSSKKKGFGIGLYQSKMIIEAHGGDIKVESGKGEGTAFTVRLPVES